MARRVVLALALVAAARGRGEATYSINGVDRERGEVGGAGTSCVGQLSVRVIYGSVPGRGVVHAQAQLGGPGRDRAVMLVGMDTDPVAIITAITAPGFDGGAQLRQYGIVDVMARTAGFTGNQTGAFAADRQGELGPFAYSVQGNILTSAAVLDNAAAAFEGSGCDLADRLMLALEAGARNGQGDSRCTSGGIPSDSGFIQVDREGEAAGSYLLLDVTDTAPQNPLVMLRAQYDVWRAQHPCPPPSASDAGPDGDAGTSAEPDAAGGCCSTGGGDASLGVVFVVGALARRRFGRLLHHEADADGAREVAG
jgi:uncharacterized Ntn-hydrolase superfamily protein